METKYFYIIEYPTGVFIFQIVHLHITRDLLSYNFIDFTVFTIILTLCFITDIYFYIQEISLPTLAVQSGHSIDFYHYTVVSSLVQY